MELRSDPHAFHVGAGQRASAQGQAFPHGAGGTQEAESNIATHWELLSRRGRLYICSRPVAEASYMARLKSREGGSVSPTTNPGQDKEVRMNWDQLIPFNILWIMQVGWSCSHVIGLLDLLGDLSKRPKVRAILEEREGGSLVWAIPLKMSEGFSFKELTVAQV